MPLISVGFDNATKLLIRQLIDALNREPTDNQAILDELQNVKGIVMSKAQELLDKFAVIETEVGETAAEVGLLKTEIEELKTKVTGNAELEAAVDSVLARADSVATGLDSLQRKVAPPPEEPE